MHKCKVCKEDLDSHNYDKLVRCNYILNLKEDESIVKPEVVE